MRRENGRKSELLLCNLSLHVSLKQFQEENKFNGNTNRPREPVHIRCRIVLFSKFKRMVDSLQIILT